jgi:hypothetical protein
MRTEREPTRALGAAAADPDDAEEEDALDSIAGGNAQRNTAGSLRTQSIASRRKGVRCNCVVRVQQAATDGAHLSHVVPSVRSSDRLRVTIEAQSEAQGRLMGCAI